MKTCNNQDECFECFDSDGVNDPLIPDTPEEFHNRVLGRKGEEAAARFLERYGYVILERNWHCQAGEADIIAKDDESIIFVEVKTRSNVDYGLPEEAVTAEKRKRYERIAAYYLKDQDLVDLRVYFDVMSISAFGDTALLRFHHNAYGRD